MKRILVACFLLTALCTVTSVQRSSAQVTHVSAAEFTVQVNLLDSYIAASNMTAAQATWDTLHRMMGNVITYTKHSIDGATTSTDKAAYSTLMKTQRDLYKTILPLKVNLAANRTMLHTRLGEFDLTIY